MKTAEELTAALDFAVCRVRDLEAELATEKRNYRALADGYDQMATGLLIGLPVAINADYTQGPIGEAYVAGHVAAQMSMHHLEQQQIYLGQVCGVLKATCEKQQARIAELEGQLGASGS